MKIASIIDFFINPIYQEDQVKFWRARLLVRASLLTSLFSSTYVYYSVIFEFEKGIYLMLFNVLGFLFLPFLVKTKIPLTWLGNLYVFIGAVAIFILTYYSGGVWSAIYPWIISIPVLALLVVNRVSGIIWGTISFISMLLFAYWAYHGVALPIEYKPEMRTVWYITILPGLLLIILFIAFVFEYIQSRALRTLAEKNHLLEEQKLTIEEQSSELEQLIEDKDYIIRILAHDLRNPLANIKSVVHLMQSESDEERREEYINIINQSSSNAHDLIDRVLEMDAIGYDTLDIQLEELDVGDVLKESINSMSELARKKQAVIELDDKSKKSQIKAERTYLYQIFNNLLSNAIKFSEEGKKIIAEMSNESNNILIRIIDEGPGIHPDEEDRLFKKFSKLSTRPTAGESSTGLGLSLVKRYVELIDGNIWYERNESKGAVFVVELPLAI